MDANLPDCEHAEEDKDLFRESGCLYDFSSKCKLLNGPVEWIYTEYPENIKLYG
jgi:hypothetical protein